MKWYLKALIQKSISLIPYGINLNYFLQRRYGELNDIKIDDKIKGIIRGFATPILAEHNDLHDLSGLRVVEIGTGWVPILPVILSFLNIQCKTFDINKNLKKEIVIKTLIEVCKELEILSNIPGFPPLEDMKEKLDKALQVSKLEGILQILGIQYEAPTDTTHLPIISNSQDVTVSRSVLSSIPNKVLPRVLDELYRILKPGGLSIHSFGLQDEYASFDPNVTSINFLKYPSWFWDKFFQSRIKYCNRARYPYYLNLFKETGFNIVSFRKGLDKNSLEALSTVKIANEFRHYSEEELATVSFTVILKKT